MPVDAEAFHYCRLMARGFSAGPISRRVDKAMRPLHAAGILKPIAAFGQPMVGTHILTDVGRAWVRVEEEGALYVALAMIEDPS